MMKLRRMRWAGHVVLMEEKRNVYKVLVENSKGKRPLGRLKRRWRDSIKMDLRAIWWGCIGWIELAQETDQLKALLSTAMNLRVP
jgi:hypothetical protein